MMDSPAVELSASEQQILDLYDRLQQLQLQLALARTRQEHASRRVGTSTADPGEEQSLEAVQDRLLECRASYSLRNSVVENVMMVNPVLKAVHHGTQASPIERDLLPFVEQRDITAQLLLRQISDLRAVTDRIKDVEVEAIKISRENVDLAAEVLQLAERVNANGTGTTSDLQLQQQLQEVERGLKASRQKWKVMKGTASGVIVGSGADWAANAQLRDIVLYPD